jgi:hypothetical protein
VGGRICPGFAPFSVLGLTVSVLYLLSGLGGCGVARTGTRRPCGIMTSRVGRASWATHSATPRRNFRRAFYRSTSVTKRGRTARSESPTTPCVTPQSPTSSVPVSHPNKSARCVHVTLPCYLYVTTVLSWCVRCIFVRPVMVRVVIVRVHIIICMIKGIPTCMLRRTLVTAR